MADRRAVNKYYPPDWDPSKGSINKHKKSHPLRDRAKKIDQGILVVRFEMPFNIWCLKCQNHVAMGVRFNAEKSRTGSYYSTPIFKFRMKCHLCDNHFEIQTDPSKFDYSILNGARRQAAPTEEACDIDQTTIDSVESKKRLTDAMYRLERKLEDKIKSDTQTPNLVQLKSWRSRFEDGFSANQLLRSQYRKKRKNLEELNERNKAILKRASLSIPLAEPSLKDKKEAEAIVANRKRQSLRIDELSKRKEILNSKLTLNPSTSNSVSIGRTIKIKLEYG